MLQGLNTTKTWAVALLLSVVVALIGTLLGLRIAQQRAESVVREKVHARGWDVRIQHLKISLAGKAHADEVCVSLKADDHDDLCIDDLTIKLRPMALFRKRIHVQKLQARTLRIDSSYERLSALRQRSKDGDDTSATDESRRVPEVQKAQIEHVDVRLEAQNRALHFALEDATLRPDHKGSELLAQGQLLAFEGGGDAMDRSLRPLIDRKFTLEAHGSVEHTLEKASLKFEERLAVPLPLASEATLSIEALTFEAPYTVRLHAPVIRSESPKLVLSAQEIETNVGVWTRHLPNFYFTSLRAQRPNLSMNAGDLKEIVRALKILGTTSTPANTSAASDAHGEAVDDAPSSHSAFGSILAQLTHERAWWEILPRAIELSEGSVTLTRVDSSAVRIQDIDLKYAVRVLHQQMDLELQAHLMDENQEAGRVDGRLEWNYTSKIGRFFWNIQDASLQALASLVTRQGSDALLGSFSSEGRLRINKKQQITGEHQTEIRDLTVDAKRFSKPVNIGTFSMSGAFDHTSIRPERASKAQTLEPNEDPEGILAPWVFKNQRIALGDAEATFQMEWTKFRPFHRPIAENIYIDLEIPTQSAMMVFESLPEVVRGPLEGTEMRGHWGLHVAFDVEHAGMDSLGRSTWEIHAPTTYEVRDKDLVLVSLPEAVDVQRLNHAMDFVFRGPNDEFMREIRIPSPQRVQALLEAEGEDGAAPASGNAKRTWVPLQDMSFYFIATQLYREDGSFFRNSGINWLQIRHVLSDALTTRRVARGASTITMQTVKNIFLTHEKTAERKFQEMFLAYWMTRTVPKDRILEVYLNIIELCPHCNGADEASRFHFGVPIRALDIRPSVWLSTISPNPTALGGAKPKGDVRYDECPRCDQILRGLHSRGWINAREYREGTTDPSPAPDVTSLDTAQGDSGEVDAMHTTPVQDSENEPPTDALDEALAGALPWMRGPDAVDADEPPLFDLLDPLEEEEGSEFERLTVNERLRTWIEGQRAVRGAR